MGEGGLEQRNVMQLLHSAYNLQTGGGGLLEFEEYQLLWSELFEEKVKKMSAPILTRWYTVGEGSSYVKKN